ncbi:MAG: hypothetical protein HY555_02805 [Euryarchaeota archaeon]|nr:hypothetical protein [Euryarchaeota archaeon]
MVRLNYIDDDPPVLVKLINRKRGSEKEAYAYADTGSDSLAIPRDLWLDLDLGFSNRAVISTVGGTATSWYSHLDVELLGERHKSVMVFYQEEGDVLLGRSVMDRYRLTFDGPNKTLEIEK